MALQLAYRATRPSLTTSSPSVISLITPSPRAFSASTALQARKFKDDGHTYADRQKLREELKAQRPDYKIRKGRKDITEYPDKARPKSKQARFFDPEDSHGKRSMVYKFKTGQLAEEVKQLRQEMGISSESGDAFTTSKGERGRDVRPSRRDREKSSSSRPMDAKGFASMMRGEEDSTPWGQDKRSNKGRERPFGGYAKAAPSGERGEKSFGSRDRKFDRGSRDGDRRGKSFGERSSRDGDGPSRGFDRSSRDGDRSSRSFGGKPRRDFGDRPPRGEDRPRRSFEDKPSRDYGDKPRRDFGDRPPRESRDRASRDFGDRPPRGFGDRPPRDFGDRPPRDFGDRPPRDFGDKPPRESRDRASRDFGDRPPRDFGDRTSRDFGDRPPRDFSDRPPREFKDRPFRDNDTYERPEPIAIPFTTAASQFLYGASSVEAAIRSSRRKLYKLYILQGDDVRQSQDADDIKAEKIIRLLAKQKNIPIEILSGKYGMRLMSKMSSSRPHNGFVLEASALPQPPIVALGPIPEDPAEYAAKPGFPVELGHQSAEEVVINGEKNFVYWRKSATHKPLVVVLDRILDPVNLGAILRSVGFFGAAAVAITNYGGTKITPVALKASAGAAEEVTIFGINSLPEFLNASRANGWEVYAAVAQEPGATRQRRQVDLLDIEETDPLKRAPCVLLLGSEGEGLDRLVVKKADYELNIPSMAGQSVVDSLNVNVAGALLCAGFLKGMQKAVLKGETVQDGEEVTKETLFQI
ncbi:putative rRNA methyltransferase mitochondrial precursor [Triangularia setosa]|uniref:rRNA methyltransferase 1, mitochondrial n=1 Tax=Triangularia setosa TaxID=2587417 RepID=A0AAN6WD23_9PEZI|nr:putative rRNA methyltransferase mitochondrial precursor [Podospora setosa]